MAWHDNLDPNSHKIASSTNSRIRVMAGPGTGKSFAMKRRVARLLEEEGVEPSKILPVTFTRVAARDLHRELVQMGVNRCEEIQGTTLHSLALRILMRTHVLRATGRTLNKFEIKPLEKDLAKYHGGVNKVKKRIKAYEAAWARLQRDNPGSPPDEADSKFEQDLQKWLRFHKTMLIGEVIYYLHEYLRSNPQAPERIEFSHILVDEFQDFNKAEQEVIKLMAGNAHVCVVGDDDQAIYSFKHADPEGILTWCKTNPGADDLKLSDCHRCPAQVVAMANALIAHNGNRPENRQLVAIPKNGDGRVWFGQYSTLAEEVQAIEKWISKLVKPKSGTLPGDILVLTHRKIIGKLIYEALAKQNVPAKSYYAETELDAIEAQERFAYLTLLADPDDRVALRWLLGLNSTTWLSASYRRLQEYCIAKKTEPWDVLISLANGEIQLPHTGHLVKRFKSIQTKWEKLSNLMKKVGLTELIDYLFPDGNTAFCEIRALALETIKNMDAKDIVKFVEELNSAIAKPEVPSEVTEVRIMSIHQSKGLSAPITIIAGCVEGLLPKEPDQSKDDQQASVAEQRRLFFVGITRVKAAPDQGKPGMLFLTCSQKMPLAQAMKAGITPASRHYEDARLDKSRFIGEMNPETQHQNMQA